MYICVINNWGILSWYFSKGTGIPLGLVPTIFNNSRPNPGRGEKNKLNIYFQTSFWCLKRFFHKTFCGTTKKCDKKNLIQILFQYNFQKMHGTERVNEILWSVYPKIFLTNELIRVYSLFLPLLHAYQQKIKTCYIFIRSVAVLTICRISKAIRA